MAMPSFWTSPAFRESRCFTIRGWYSVRRQRGAQLLACPRGGRRNTSSVRYGRLIGWGLLELPRLGALPALEESLGRAKNMDPARGRIHAGRVHEPRAGPEKTLTDEGE